MAGNTRGRMKWTSAILLVLSVVFYLLKNVFHYSPFYINVLNDLLAVPVFLMVMEFLMTRVYGSRFQMSWLHVLVTVVVISVLSEIVFPMYAYKTTADPVDVLLYAVGGLIYMVVLQFGVYRKVSSTQSR